MSKQSISVAVSVSFLRVGRCIGDERAFAGSDWDTSDRWTGMPAYYALLASRPGRWCDNLRFNSRACSVMHRHYLSQWQAVPPGSAVLFPIAGLVVFLVVIQFPPPPLSGHLRLLASGLFCCCSVPSDPPQPPRAATGVPSKSSSLLILACPPHRGSTNNVASGRGSLSRCSRSLVWSAVRTPGGRFADMLAQNS